MGIPSIPLNLQRLNSTSYVDLLAIQLGLHQDRLPGETSSAFLARLYSAATARRDHSMEGVVNDIAHRLGVKVQAGITVTPTNPATVITASAGRITITTGGQSTVIPTVTVDADRFWNWRKLSEVVADIDALPSCTASLLIPDAFAVQLVPQSSLNCAIAEPVARTENQLKHQGVVVGSELFSNATPSYTLTAAGKLIFSGMPPADTAVSYVYNLSPFTLVCSEVSVLSLMDPALKETAVGDGEVVYQVREFAHQILSQDPCYWG